ncbi:C2 domain-containing protein [Sporormia fimetaria CBS 119925]|uniref:C2 domain-containing protein n=1 Tax=Sporormia fimetaria CBS 119925 TaxID=1340428 RepID=A0A6A6V0R4_9PLEO|nr:C2 domain-containing protein [Sporormia fimetaria CBS 119925]
MPIEDEKRKADASADQTLPTESADVHETEQLPHPAPQQSRTSSSKKKDKGPAGGFDATPVPYAPPGWTVKITFHRATNLPLADISTLAADPFIVAEIQTQLPTRHKNDPPLKLRTPTIRQSTNPEWNVEWIVANVPASGFRMKCRIFDEDPADHDDRLGNAHVETGPINETWSGIRDQSFKIKKRMASKRAYMLRGVAVCLGKLKHMDGYLNVSVEVLGKTEGENGGRVYTIGPQYWIRHYSPLLGRLLGQKEPREGGVSKRTGRPKPERYNFQANQMQLRGPVPEAMYHRYVEFKPFVHAMFTSEGVRGFILSKALHHQHGRVYNFDQNTAYERFEEPCLEFTQKFLDLVHHDQGGRIFTYVLTLDALFRFTETGKEFGIDMLSKHTMHSDVAAYVAFSGEFFIRRFKHAHRPKQPSESESSRSKSTGSVLSQQEQTHPPHDISNGPPSTEPPENPYYYQLVIDNDSGTYRPNAKLLPDLKRFLSASFPGLHILTIDCQEQAEEMAKMKQQQRDRKKKEGDQIIYTQVSRSSSMSSSDLEELDRLEEAGEMPESHLRDVLRREAEAKKDAKVGTMRGYRDGWNARRAARKDERGEEEEVTDPLVRMREEAERLEKEGHKEAHMDGRATEGTKEKEKEKQLEQ